jgi:ribA/ribD-fused uncharacterized protein
MSDAITTFDGSNFFLSNFWTASVVVDSKKFPTTEHAYQAFKTLDPEWFSAVQNARSAGQAKKLGNQVPLRKDWETAKDEVMRKCLVAKFSIPELRDQLLATGDAELVEGNNWHDRHWGKCNCKNCGGEGKNMLGKMLMQLRDELRSAK